MKGAAPRYVGGWVLVVVLALVALGGATQSRAAQACVPPGQGPNVCVTVTVGPEGASVSTAALERFVTIDATVSNEGGNSVNHATLRISPVDPTLSAGFSFVSLPTASTGSCSYSAAALAITCDIGQMRGGDGADIGVTLRTPTAAGVQGLTFTAQFAEGPTDQNPNPGKTDTVELTEQIDVKNELSTEATFVPANTAATLTVEQDGRTDTLNLPPQDFDTTARLEFTPTADLPFTCPKKQVCRIGTPWLTATVPGTFDPEAEIDFFWPAGQVSTNQTVKNVALFYVATPGAQVEIISARCNAQLSVVPCLKDILLPKSGPLKGSLAFTLVTDHNGHMR